MREKIKGFINASKAGAVVSNSGSYGKEMKQDKEAKLAEEAMFGSMEKAFENFNLVFTKPPRLNFPRDFFE